MGLFAALDSALRWSIVRPSAAKTLRDDFLGWQCRIRQIAMRQDGGRPSPGMRPRVLDATGRELSPALTVLIVPRDPAESTDFFRFQVMKHADPRDLYQRGLSYLQADYFQRPAEFGDLLTAVFRQAPPSRLDFLKTGGVCSHSSSSHNAIGCRGGLRGRARRGDPGSHALAQSPVQSFAAGRRPGARFQAGLEIGRGLIWPRPIVLIASNARRARSTLSPEDHITDRRDGDARGQRDIRQNACFRRG